MSQDQNQHRPGVSPEGPYGGSYVLTEEERRVLKECNDESFRYRSVPISIFSMVLTQGLVSRGTLSASPRFGSLPKVAFAGICGFMAGKISYMKTCQEKLKNLENSPLGEALRQRQYRLSPQSVPQSQRNTDEDVMYDSTYAQQDVPSSSSLYSDSYSDSAYQPFSSALSESAPSGANSDLGPSVPALLPDEDEPRKRSVRYEELRSRNRENYEVIMNQKAEALHKPTPQRDVPQKQVQKNAYGDTWEE